MSLRPQNSDIKMKKQEIKITDRDIKLVLSQVPKGTSPDQVRKALEETEYDIVDAIVLLNNSL